MIEVSPPWTSAALSKSKGLPAHHHHHLKAAGSSARLKAPEARHERPLLRHLEIRIIPFDVLFGDVYRA